MISQADEAYNTAIFHGIQLCKHEEFCDNYELFLNTLKSTRDIDVLWNTFFSIGVPKWELKHIAESLNIIFSSNIDEKSLEAFNASNIFEHETADALWGFLNGFRQNVPDIPPESFDVCSRRAIEEVELRLYSQPDETQYEDVRMCLCAVSELIHKWVQNGDKKSESIDGYSVTFSDTAPITVLINAAVARYLAKHGLLYRGV